MLDNVVLDIIVLLLPLPLRHFDHCFLVLVDSHFLLVAVDVLAVVVVVVVLAVVVAVVLAVVVVHIVVSLPLPPLPARLGLYLAACRGWRRLLRDGLIRVNM